MGIPVTGMMFCRETGGLITGRAYNRDFTVRLLTMQYALIRFVFSCPQYMIKINDAIVES